MLAGIPARYGNMTSIRINSSSEQDGDNVAYGLYQIVQLSLHRHCIQMDYRRFIITSSMYDNNCPSVDKLHISFAG